MNYGKSLCILCDKLLAGATLIAHPCDCPTHHFHCECLVKHARQQRECPIDQIPFESVICANGLPISFPKPGGSRKAKAARVPEKKNPFDKPKTRNQGGSSADNRREEVSVNMDSTASMSGSRIMIQSDAVNSDPLDGLAASALSDFATLSSALQESGCVMCALCGKNMEMHEMTSPNCCSHWFHYSCLDKYTDKSDICPFEGCYREIETFTTAAGDNYGLRVSEARDYRNMVNAPDNFVCCVCDRADLHKNRAVAKPCGHLLHRSCLIDYVRENKRCPLCKEATSAVECDTAGLLFFP